MKQLINIIIASLLFHTSAAWSAEVQISCNYQSFLDNSEYQRVYILNLEKLSVSDVAAIPPHEGELQISDNFYQIDFPQTATRATNMAIINRYTGKFEGEVGLPPYGTSKEGNWIRKGRCKKMKNKKLF